MPDGVSFAPTADRSCEGPPPRESHLDGDTPCDLRLVHRPDRPAPHELAERAGEELEGAPPLEVLRWAVDRFSPRFAITASMQDTVLPAHELADRPRRSGDLPRHRLPLRRDDRHRRRRRAGLRPQPAAHPSAADRRAAGRGLRPGAVRARPRPLLPDAQGAAAAGGACAPTTPGPRACGATRARAARAPASSSGTRSKNKVKINPLVAWSDEQIDAYIEAQRRPGQPAAVRGLRQRRLRAVHPPGPRPRRPLGRREQGRVRVARLTEPGAPPAVPAGESTRPLLRSATAAAFPASAAMLRVLVDNVADRLPEVDVRLGFIELSAPAADRRAATSSTTPVVVPLLLSRGTHVARDLPGDAAPPLGPDRCSPRSCSTASPRPRSLGHARSCWRRPDRRRPRVRTTSGRRPRCWPSRPGRTGRAASSPQPTRRWPRRSRQHEPPPAAPPAVVSYFLAPGLLPDAARASRGRSGDHPAVADLVVARYRARGSHLSSPKSALTAYRRLLRTE